MKTVERTKPSPLPALRQPVEPARPVATKLRSPLDDLRLPPVEPAKPLATIPPPVKAGVTEAQVKSALATIGRPVEPARPRTTIPPPIARAPAAKVQAPPVPIARPAEPARALAPLIAPPVPAELRAPSPTATPDELVARAHHLLHEPGRKSTRQMREEAAALMAEGDVILAAAHRALAVPVPKPVPARAPERLPAVPVNAPQVARQQPAARVAQPRPAATAAPAPSLARPVATVAATPSAAMTPSRTPLERSYALHAAFVARNCELADYCRARGWSLEACPKDYSMYKADMALRRLGR